MGMALRRWLRALLVLHVNYMECTASHISTNNSDERGKNRRQPNSNCIINKHISASRCVSVEMLASEEQPKRAHKYGEKYLLAHYNFLQVSITIIFLSSFFFSSRSLQASECMCALTQNPKWSHSKMKIYCMAHCYSIECVSPFGWSVRVRHTVSSRRKKIHNFHENITKIYFKHTHTHEFEWCILCSNCWHLTSLPSPYIRPFFSFAPAYTTCQSKSRMQQRVKLTNFCVLHEIYGLFPSHGNSVETSVWNETHALRSELAQAIT